MATLTLHMGRSKHISYLDMRQTPAYSKEVLLGNWIDRRYDDAKYDNGILPGLKAIKGCERHTTSAQDDYTNKAFRDPDIVRKKCELGVAAFDNYLQNSTTAIFMQDTFEHLQNFTTMHNLLYDIMPKVRMEAGLKEAARAKACLVPHNPPEIDTLQSFGNQTKTGLREHLNAVQAMSRIDYGRTTYMGDYVYRGIQRHQ